MIEKGHRRRSNRLPLRWKAALAFDAAQGRPLVHTRTQDLSPSGAAIFSEYGDLTGSVVTLLLAHPPRRGETAPKVLMVRSRVVSTARTPGMSEYRHGLSFIRARNDGLDILSAILQGIEAAGSGREPAAGAAAAASAARMESSRLEPIKHLAYARPAEARAIDQRLEFDELISDSLERAYRYLRSFVDRLNVAKPAFARGYAIVGVPEFRGLAWEIGSADVYAREVLPTHRLSERVSLHFLLSGGKGIHIGREYPASEKLQQLLDDSGIEYTTQGVWSKRGSLERTTFDFACEVKASLQLVGQFDTGQLLIRARNVSGFGSLEQIVAPEAVTDESLDELSAFILGESPGLGPLLLRQYV